LSKREEVPWWLKAVLGFTVVGGALYIVWHFVSQVFGGGKAIEAIQQEIAKIWVEYEKEYEAFLKNDGTIDANEQKLLDAKLPLVEKAMDDIVRIARTAAEMTALVAIVIVGAIALYKIYKVHVGAKAQEYLKRVQQKVGMMDPASGTLDCYSAVEELGMIFRGTGIMDLADRGLTGLASTALTVEQSGYFSSLLPQMHSHYNLLAAQLPYLTGMQFLYAQFTMTQLNIYIGFYAATLPPLFTMLPLI